jgi:hypothetical protein
MILTRLFTTIITLDIQSIYTLDIKAKCKELLRARFKSKCYSKCLILDIDEVLRVSDRRILPTESVDANISVEFSAQVIQYERGELLIPTITYIGPDGMYANATDTCADIRIKNRSIYKYSVGSTVPCICLSSIYKINKERIAIISQPFLPEHMPGSAIYLIYPQNGEVNPEQLSTIKLAIDEIEIEREKLAIAYKTPASKYAVEFFTNLLYIYSKNNKSANNIAIKMNKMRGANHISIDNLTSIPPAKHIKPTDKPIIQQFPVLINYSEVALDKNFSRDIILTHIDMENKDMSAAPTIGDIRTKIENEPWYNEFAAINILDIFSAAVCILDDYAKHLRMIQMLSEKYPTKDSIGKMSSIWETFNGYKL